MHRHQWIIYNHHRRGWVYKCIICGKLWDGR
nr:MAG TPA: C2H2 type zinc-finger protein [Caudoviricetes sp.]DAL43973.1 MAG TPA_asm: C2H2 type zinc-finger protein [Caudoviricetes sp.]DAV13458.1 MAG TPA: C2H2 type zinc-finger protein [Caudoviricetes sp.]DAV48082.1 MAG TPA: C2H2 type zinc-finger protein [Caudoviricetes sp.]